MAFSVFAVVFAVSALFANTVYFCFLQDRYPGLGFLFLGLSLVSFVFSFVSLFV